MTVTEKDFGPRTVLDTVQCFRQEQREREAFLRSNVRRPTITDQIDAALAEAGGHARDALNVTVASRYLSRTLTDRPGGEPGRWRRKKMPRNCADCGQPIDLSAFPEGIKAENARRCNECAMRALWLFMTDGLCEIDDPDALEILGDLVALDALDDEWIKGGPE